VAFYRANAVGLAFILLVVALAVVGVFGTSSGQVRAEGGDLAVTVSYPSVIRYKMADPLEVTIAVGDRDIEDVSVAISSSYLDAFSDVTFVPGIDLMTEEEALIGVDGLGAHETRVVSGSLQAERYWLHEGWLEVRDGGTTLARVELATFVFP
jgi:hypothetical protein